MNHLLKDFKDEGYRTTSICTTLRNYHIHIIDGNIFDKVEKLKIWNEYLKEVDALISSISSEIKYKGCKKVWPIYLILGLVLLVFILGILNFKEAFGVVVFDNNNTWINNFTIFNYH